MKEKLLLICIILLGTYMFFIFSEDKKYADRLEIAQKENNIAEMHEVFMQSHSLSKVKKDAFNAMISCCYNSLPMACADSSFNSLLNIAWYSKFDSICNVKVCDSIYARFDDELFLAVKNLNGDSIQILKEFVNTINFYCSIDEDLLLKKCELAEVKVKMKKEGLESTMNLLSNRYTRSKEVQPEIVGLLLDEMIDTNDLYRAGLFAYCFLHDKKHSVNQRRFVCWLREQAMKKNDMTKMFIAYHCTEYDMPLRISILTEIYNYADSTRNAELMEKIFLASDTVPVELKDLRDKAREKRNEF